jgi:hypothetical protein
MIDKRETHTTKLEQIYIINDESPINFKTKNFTLSEEDELKSNIGKILTNPKFNHDMLKIFNGIDYLNLGTINLIEKKFLKKEKGNKQNNFKKLNKEKLCTIFKCIGINMIYCPHITEKVFNDLSVLIEFKSKHLEYADSIKSTVVIKQSIFYDIAKNVIRTLTGAEYKFSKYFHLSYLLISK